MTRLAATIDRLAVLIAGLVLLVLGASLVILNDPDQLPDVQRTLDTSGLGAAARTGWWPWALAVAGIVAVIVAVRWLLMHTPAAKVKSLPLRTGGAGVVTVDLGEVATAAGHALEESIDVDSAHGKAIIDRGTRTVDLVVEVSPHARATEITTAVDSACASVAAMLGDPTVATRTTIHVVKRAKNAHRVS